ncbi:MAG TPA: peptidylprolyl isomerase, partial [Gemmatimonadales bacterium]|nr:peptidylprolyl isomerase [Gemmatimonadales bacterium]
EARRYRAELQQDGADFAAAARRESADTVTGPNGGFLPALRRQELPDVGRFGEVAWSLGPGEVGGPALSPAGVHIFRRAVQAEARPGLKIWLRPVLTRTTDSLWIDSMGQARRLTLASDVVPRLRAMGLEPFDADQGGPIATWEGGELTAQEARMWVAALPVVERVAMPGAPDSAITLFAEQLAERDMVAQEANGSGITPLAWQSLAPQFHQAVTATLDAYRSQLGNGEATEATRNWLRAVSTGGQPYRPLPGLLGAVLRDRAKVTVNRDVVDAIVRESARAWRLQYGMEDSTSAAVDTTVGQIGADSTP